MLYSVIATDGKRRDLIDQTIQSLASCRIPADYAGLVIVENNPVAELYGCDYSMVPFPVQYCYLDRFSKSAALNLALESLPTESVVYFHDDDMTFDPGALEAMVEAVRKLHSHAFFTGPLRIRYQTPPPPWMVPSLPRSVSGWQLDSQQIEPCDVLPELGGNWAARVSDLKNIGGFSERFGPGQDAFGEDALAQRQLTANGIRAYYVPGAISEHYVPESSCKPAWVLSRSYKSCIMKGMSLRQNRKAPIPLLIFKKWIRLVMATVEIGFHELRRDRAKAFDAQVRCARIRGLLQGMLTKDALV